MRRAQAPLCLALALAVLPAVPRTAAAAAQVQHPEVLVIVNGANEISRAIGRSYAARRGVPARNVLALDLPLVDPTLTTWQHQNISRRRFERQLRDPIAAHLRRHDPEGRIRILVTTKGLPLRIGDPKASERPYSQRTWASVDAELALLGSGLDGSPGLGSVVNPYFASDLRFDVWRAQHPDAPLRYLVARLTGYQTGVDPETGVPRDVARLIAAAQSDDAGSLYAIDEDPRQNPLRDQGNRVMLAPAAAALRALGRRVEHDRSPAMLRNLVDLAGYASWGSNDRQSAGPPYYGEIDGDRIPGSFAARSVAIDLVSTNARSFSDPTRYGQSLVADLIRSGAAGVAGHVYEPTLAGVPRPYLLLGAYVQGVPAVEAYFRSVPYLGWTNVWIGDPLMQVLHPAPRPADRDGDGIPDERDDCLWMPDPDQRDTDGDGFGNLCDPDLDGNGVVEGGEGAASDLARLERAMRTGLYVPDPDLDGDGRIDARDMGIAQLYLHLPPGPSGRSTGVPPGPSGRSTGVPPGPSGRSSGAAAEPMSP
jgi:uncharacterized protein (TIGR03790 family)